MVTRTKRTSVAGRTRTARGEVANEWLADCRLDRGFACRVWENDSIGVLRDGGILLSLLFMAMVNTLAQ